MKREHLFAVTKADFDIQTSRGSGPGGQNKNKVETAVRIVHRDSGAVGESRTERSQLTNKHLAFARLVQSPKFRIWLARRAYEVREGRTIDQRIDAEMAPENLRIETKDEHGNWRPYTDNT